MTETGFQVALHLPVQCRSGLPDPTAIQGSLLLLRVINLQMAHETDADPGQEKLEARLDLMLHWLGLQLFGARPRPEARTLHASADWLGLADHGLAPGAELTVSLYLHPALPAPVELAGRVMPGGEIALLFADETMAEAWRQWLFRQLRREVHAARAGA